MPISQEIASICMKSIGRNIENSLVSERDGQKVFESFWTRMKKIGEC